MDHEQVKRLPVVDDVGRLVGIVSRGDLLKVRQAAQVSGVVAVIDRLGYDYDDTFLAELGARPVWTGEM